MTLIIRNKLIDYNAFNWPLLMRIVPGRTNIIHTPYQFHECLSSLRMTRKNLLRKECFIVLLQ